MKKQKKQSAADSIKELLKGTQGKTAVSKEENIIIPVNAGQMQDKPRKPGTFKPGQSGNPAGSKPGYKHFKTLAIEAIKAMGDTKDGKKMEIGRAMTQAIINQALKGDVRAYTAIADRVDGKPETLIANDGGEPFKIQAVDPILNKAYGEQ